MSGHLELQARVEEAANRLRAVQTDLADADSTLREEALSEEVERLLGSVAPGERDEFLRRLGARFPSWDGDRSMASAPAAASPARSGADQRELNDPSWLLEKLLGMLSEMDEGQRESIRRRLIEAGMVSGGPGDWPVDAAEKFRRAVGAQASAEAGIDPGRLLELAGVLAEFVTSVEKLVWRAWQEISPRSPLKRGASLNGSMGKFSTGDGQVSLNELRKELERLRQLTVGIIGAMSGSANLVYNRVQTLSPDAVMAAAKDEGKKAWESWEVAYWRKYRELAATLDQPSFEKEVREALADSIMALIGRAR